MERLALHSGESIYKSFDTTGTKASFSPLWVKTIIFEVVRDKMFSPIDINMSRRGDLGSDRLDGTVDV